MTLKELDVDMEDDLPIEQTEQQAQKKLEKLAPQLYGHKTDPNLGLKLTPEFTSADVRAACATRLNKLPKKHQKILRRLVDKGCEPHIMGGFVLSSLKDLVIKDIDVMIAPGTGKKAKLGEHKSFYHEGWKLEPDSDMPIDIWERDKMESNPQTWSEATAAPMLNLQCVLIEINYHPKTNKFVVPHIYDAGFMHSIFHGVIEITPQGEKCKRWKYNMDKAMRKAIQLNFAIGPGLTQAICNIIMLAKQIDGMDDDQVTAFKEELEGNTPDSEL